MNLLIKLIKPFVGFVVIALLAGCKADSLEIKISNDDVAKAISGKDSSVAFEAEFELFGNLDAKQKAELDRLIDLTDSYMDIDDIEIEKTMMGSKLIIEGLIPISVNKSTSPWYIKVSKWNDLLVEVKLETGTKFGALKSAITAVNMMLSPDPYHETKYKLKASGNYVLAPAVEIDGETHLFYSNNVDGRLTMKFVGDPFKNTGAGFLIDIN
jgi:hypothetical protein